MQHQFHPHKPVFFVNLMGSNMSTASGELLIGPVTPCQLAYQNGGYCRQKISNDDESLLDIFASGGMIETCICPPGFSVLTCENQVEQC